MPGFYPVKHQRTSSNAARLTAHGPRLPLAAFALRGCNGQDSSAPPCAEATAPMHRHEPRSTGVGVAVGGRSPLAGWTVESPMAESPAEEAGIRRGERILAVGVLSCSTS